MTMHVWSIRHPYISWVFRLRDAKKAYFSLAGWKTAVLSIVSQGSREGSVRMPEADSGIHSGHEVGSIDV